MPLAAWLAALAALLAILCLDGARAACVTNEYLSHEEGSSGCQNCTADGARCEACWEGWGLTKSGECKLCLPKLRLDEYGNMDMPASLCTSCDGDAPDICTACEDRCDQYGCDGFFLPEIKEGINCTACPIFGCAACEDLTGKCTKCRSGLALLDGECRRCRAFECQQCDGGLDKCTSCYLPNAFGKEGFYADAAGNCTQCPKGCAMCDLAADGQLKCSECIHSPLDPKTSRCQACGTPNCKKCLPGESPAPCQECDEGFGLVNQTCQPCKVQGCAACDDDTATCTTCLGSAALVNGTACVPCPAGCEACDDPASCTYCEDSLVFDAAQSRCVPCKVPGCNLCVDKSSDKCLACQLRYTLNETTQLCEPVACKVAGCLSCSEDPARCDAEGCGTGKWYDEANSACTPCSGGCSSCSQWGCAGCADGYWMDAAIRKCNKCTAGDTHAAC